MRGKKHLEDLQEKCLAATTLMQRETQRLVDHTNDLLEKMGSDCKTNLATIHSDLSEINDKWQLVRQDTLLNAQVMIQKEAYDATIKSALESLDEFEIPPFLKQQMLDSMLEKAETRAKKLMLDALKTSFAHLSEDRIIEALMSTGFELPDEQWTDWTEGDGTCDCQKTRSCIEKWTRTCETGNCIGPASKDVDVCNAEEKDDLTFFQVCNNNDNVFVGQCEKEDGGGGVFQGRYVSGSVFHGGCYKDCKRLPGATGCQFKTRECNMDMCFGDCYAFTEPVRGESTLSMTMMPQDITCYVFSTVKGVGKYNTDLPALPLTV